MNIFYLHTNPIICAEYHCDKHVVKMIVEYAQLLSTAHRILDGEEYHDVSKNNRKLKRFRLKDEREHLLYKASHINHPSNIWVRDSKFHYEWLYKLFIQCCVQYTKRYSKTHKSEELIPYLIDHPTNISNNKWNDPPPAMPDKYKVPSDIIKSYQNFYIGDKVSFARWKPPSTPPKWFTDALGPNYQLSTTPFTPLP